MTPIDILIAARDLLSDRDRWAGHHKINPPADPRNCQCMATSVWHFSETGSGDPSAIIARAALLEAVGADPGYDYDYSNWHVIYDYNDHPDRTHAEVIAAFDRAIESLR